MRNQYNLDTANEKKAGRSLKTEYTVIEYVPVAGARASATSAVRRDVSDRETERLSSILKQLSLSRCQRSISARKYWVAPNTAMKATGLKILLYGAGGEPGRG